MPKAGSSMNRRSFLLSSLGTPILAGCMFEKPHVIRFRLGLSAQITGVAHRAFTIFENRWDRNWIALPETGAWERRRTGDALTLDLGSNRFLFGIWDILSWTERNSFEASSQDVFNILPQRRDLGDRIKSGAAFDDLAVSTNEVILPKIEWPQLVFFSDIRDIRTARPVSLEGIEYVLGPGSSIDAVSLCVTQDSISRGIERRLPWWDKLGTFTGDVYPGDQNPTYQKLQKSHFLS